VRRLNYDSDYWSWKKWKWNIIKRKSRRLPSRKGPDAEPRLKNVDSTERIGGLRRIRTLTKGLRPTAEGTKRPSRIREKSPKAGKGKNPYDLGGEEAARKSQKEKHHPPRAEEGNGVAKGGMSGQHGQRGHRPGKPCWSHSNSLAETEQAPSPVLAY